MYSSGKFSGFGIDFVIGLIKICKDANKIFNEMLILL